MFGQVEELGVSMRINWRAALALRLPDLSVMTARVHVSIPCLDSMSRFHVSIPCLDSMSRFHVSIPCLDSMSQFHVSMKTRRLDEDQTLRLDAVLILAPLHPAVCDVGAIALAGHHGFLKLSFSAWMKVQTARSSTSRPHSATSPRKAKSLSLTRSSNQARVLTGNGLRPVSAHLPRRNAAGLTHVPRPDNRRVLTPMPNCAVAWRHDRVPISTAATARSRRSIRQGFAHPCWPPFQAAC
jgi:hypothetical protein